MIPLSPPDFTGVRSEHLLHALRLCEQGKGDEVLFQFEKEFGELTGSKCVVAVSSATSGLHLALMALGVGEGDEVMCPTFTFAASAFPIMYQKAVPIFVDSETDSWNMSSIYLENAIQSRIKIGKKPKAIIVVHAYGMPADLEQLLSIASNYDIPLIEDAANALGSTWKNEHVGSFGQVGIFSFNRNKIISAAAGGAVVTNDGVLAHKIRYLAHQAKTPAPYYHHEEVGYNYGTSPILAELIRLQLPSLRSRVEKRRNLFLEYRQHYHQNATFQQEHPHSVSNRWLTVIQSMTAIPLLSTHGQSVWKPLHKQPVFEKMPYYGANESQLFFERSICLPFTHASNLSPFPLNAPY